MMLAKFEALQKRAPEPCPKRAPSVLPYAREGGAPGASADPEVALLEVPLP